MELLFLLAHSQSEDAMVLLVLAIPAFVLITYALWCATGENHEEE